MALSSNHLPRLLLGARTTSTAANPSHRLMLSASSPNHLVCTRARRCFSTNKSAATTTKAEAKPSAAQLTPFKRVNAAEIRITETLIYEVKRYEDKHEKVLREKATPEALLNASLLEDELRAEMAVALGRMDTKLREKMRVMEEANERVLALLRRPNRDVPALLEAVSVFNIAQEAAYEARLDLIVQRQCAGFVQNNYHLIMSRYPVPPKKRVKMHYDT